VNGGHLMRPFSRKSRLQRLRKSGMPEVGSDKALKTGVIAAGGLAALTAASAGISSLRRESDG
jgi:hypothetical protein